MEIGLEDGILKLASVISGTKKEVIAKYARKPVILDGDLSE